MCAEKGGGQAVGCRMNSVLKERHRSVAGNSSGSNVVEVEHSRETLITVRIMIGISGFVRHGTADRTLGSKVLFQSSRCV